MTGLLNRLETRDQLTQQVGSTNWQLSVNAAARLVQARSRVTPSAHLALSARMNASLRAIVHRGTERNTRMEYTTSYTYSSSNRDSAETG